MRESLIVKPGKTPDTLTGRKFEDLLLKSAAYSEAAGILTMGRYGVQVALIDNVWTPQSSLPDFDGVVAGGRQFVLEAKVNGQASFRIGNTTFFKERQYRHMAKRHQFGAAAYLVIHFNRRELKTKTDEAFTCAFPVDPTMEIWRQFEKDHTGVITRELACEQGILIPWGSTARGRTNVPDLHFLTHPQN